jgi:predicted unusual protein kinase regulating ubiquinone biosynthesis (AarF/ABC1/UbiB family)
MFAAELVARFAILRFTTNDTKSFGMWLRAKLQELGPVYIKIGQIIATNNEIPGDIAEELSMLQDQADGIMFTELALHPAFDIDLPRELIHVDDAPIAAASIGIVYKGKWLDRRDGIVHDVAIKAMRPNIKRQMCAALWGTSRFCRQLSKHSKTAHHMLDVARQYRRSIYSELNYIREADNMDKLAYGMRPIADWNRCPNIFAATKSIIIMEYLKGTKITDVVGLKQLGLRPAFVAKNLMEAFLYQCLTSDIFHSDPHPGNISINVDNTQRPYIIWYDSGSIVKCTESWRRDLVMLAVSLAKADVKGIINALERMGVTREDVRARRAVSRFARILLSNQDMSSSETMALITKEIEENATWKDDLRRAFVSNSKYVIFGKSIILINQNCTAIDPNFNLLTTSMPIVQKLWPNAVDINVFQEFSTMARDLSQLPSKITMLEAQVADMSDDMIDKQTSNIQKTMILQFVAYVTLLASWMHLQ